MAESLENGEECWMLAPMSQIVTKQGRFHMANTY